MKVIVTGASGLLGRAVVRQFEQKAHQVIPTAFSRSTGSLQKLDVTDSNAVKTFIAENKPDAFIHCAAERRPDVAEKNKEATKHLNAVIPAEIATNCKEAGVYLVYISTDYVFDGKNAPYETESKPNPLNFYGETKLAGEEAVHGADPSALVLRVPVLYGKVESNDESAVNILIDAVMNPKKQVTMDHYAKRYPTNVDDIGKALADIAELKSKGKDVPSTLHFSANQCYTKYEMCQIFGEILNVPIDHLTPQTTIDANAAANRPYDCRLSTSALEKLGIPIDTVDFKTWFTKALVQRH